MEENSEKINKDSAHPSVRYSIPTYLSPVQALMTYLCPSFSLSGPLQVPYEGFLFKILLHILTFLHMHCCFYIKYVDAVAKDSFIKKILVMWDHLTSHWRPNIAPFTSSFSF